jgi:hypothetical protein
LLDALIMDNAIHQAITALSALIKDTDSEDAERIREIVERLQNFDAQTACCTEKEEAQEAPFPTVD